MIRHEIIALHLATTYGKAEFYPSCSQIKVGGSETGAPNPDECVTFPGGYKDSDPGIYDTQVFDPSAPYIFPGPPIASFVGGNGTTSTSGGNSSSTMVPSTATATATTTSSTIDSAPPTSVTTSTASSYSTPPTGSSQASEPGHTCQVTIPSYTPSSDIVLYPRHFSRIMRRLFAFRENRH